MMKTNLEHVWDCDNDGNLNLYIILNKKKIKFF